jgi:MinD-like ATPase involved in chromosome partitioning or flagellar assembly
VTGTLRVATVAGDPDREAALAAQLSPRHDVDLVLRCVDRVELLAVIRGGDLDALVAVGVAAWLDAQSLEEAVERDVRLVAVVDDPDQAGRLGLPESDIFAPDSTVDAIIERCLTPREPVSTPRSRQPRAPKGKLIAVWGPKGAPGRTSIAIELASELAATDPYTLLVDGDPYGGDILQLLGILDELPTTIWAARMAAKEELDAARLALDLRRVGKSGPVLLPGLARAELWPELSDYGWRQLLTMARASFNFTVCDVGFCLEPERASYVGGEGRNMVPRATLAEADRVVAVCRADPTGIKNFLWAYEQLDELGVADGAVIVANKVHDGEQREVAELLRRHVAKRPLSYVPDRPQEFAASVRAGCSVHDLFPGSDVGSALRSLAAALGGKVAARGVLAKLSGRR